MCSPACQILGKPSNLECVEGSPWPSASWPAPAPCKHIFGCKGTEIHLLHRRRSLCISQLKLWLTPDSCWWAERCGRLLAMLSCTWCCLVFTKCKYMTQAESNKLSSPILRGNSSRESQILETWDTENFLIVFPSCPWLRSSVPTLWPSRVSRPPCQLIRPFTGLSPLLLLPWQQWTF